MPPNVTGSCAGTQCQLRAINTVFPLISMACASITCGLFATRSHEEQRRIYWHLVLWNAVTDILAAAADLLLWLDADRGYCLAGSMSITFFDWASVAWVAAVTNLMWQVICVQQPMTKTTVYQLKLRYHLSVWGSALLLALLPLVGGFQDGFPVVYGVPPVGYELKP